MKAIPIICFFTLAYFASPLAMPVAWGMGGYSKLAIPQVKYRGGDFQIRAGGVASLLTQIAKRTSIEVGRGPVDIEITDPGLYRFPFIFMGGDEAFDPLTRAELKILRNYLNYGGFLLIDDNSSKRDSPFDTSVRKMISSLFPQTPMQKLKKDHSIYRSFYLISRVALANRTEQAVLVHSFDLAEIKSFRETWGVYRDRRPDQYAALMTMDGRV